MSDKGQSRFIACKVLCFHEKLQELTGKSTDLWVDVTIDLTAIIAIKKDIKEDDTEQTAVYFHGGDYFVIDLVYEEISAQWVFYNEKMVYS